MRRREFLKVGAGASVVSIGGTPVSAQEKAASLKDAAAAKGLIFGCAVKSRELIGDKPFAASVANEAAMLVHEYEFKRQFIEKKRGSFDFADAEKVISFARGNAQKIRGHTLAWYTANPDWLPEAMNASASLSEKEKLLTGYASTMARRYAGRMHSWDVVNEAVEPQQMRQDGMRKDCIWFDAFGEEYIDLAFHAAKEADPHALLFLNDYGVEAPIRWNEERRAALLSLLDRLMKRNVPVEGFGIQAHLHPYRDNFDQRVFEKFVRQLEGYGLKLMITEFDVSDHRGPADSNRRDADVAAVTRDFLDVALGSTQTIGVLTWGLSDRYSWLSKYPVDRWPDGQLSRGLPLDGALKRKPMWNEMVAAFGRATAR